MNHLRLLRVPALMIVAALCAACASSGDTKGGSAPGSRQEAKAGEAEGKGKLDPASPEARAVHRWQLIVGGKLEEAYLLLSPGARSTRPKDQWVKETSQRPVSWSAARYFDKVCESEDRCMVRLEVDYTAPLAGSRGGMMTNSTFVTERWLRIDGSWYFVPE